MPDILAMLVLELEWGEEVDEDEIEDNNIGGRKNSEQAG